MELAKAYVQIVPSANGIKGSITEAIGGEADNAGTQAGNSIASKIKNAIIAAGIGKIITSVIGGAISEGGKLEQSIGGIETLFKSSAERMKQYANEAYKTAGISANNYMEQATSFSASLLQSLGGDTEKAASYANRAIIDMSDNANKMGTGIENIQNAYQGFAKQNYTMLDNLKLGYGGTKEEMARLITDASKMKDAQEKLNVTVKDGDMSFGNIVNAISVMQESLGIAGTTSKEAASTLEGSFNSMKAAASNFLGNMALGNDIKPSLKALIDTTCTYLFENLAPAIGNVLTALPGAIGEIVSVGYEMGLEFINNISKGLSGNVSNFISNALPMLLSFSSELKNKAGTLVDAGLNMIMELAKGIADSLPALIEYVPQIVTNIANIINENMPKILETGFQIIVTLAQGIINSIPTLIDNIGNIITAIFSVWQAINWIDLGKNLIDGIKNGIKNMWNGLKQTASDLFNGLKDKVVEIFNNISSSASNIWNSVKNAIVNFVQQIFTNVSLIFNNMKSGISGIFQGISQIASSIWSGIKSIIHSVASGIWLSVKGVFSSMSSGISSIFGGIKSVATSVWNGIKSAITSPMESAKKLIKGIIDAIKGFFNFKISWPKIPLPHFSVKPKGWGIGDLLKGKIPSLGISWYAKAMDNPMALDGATIFGMSNGNLLGGGEKGTEYITGEKGLTRIISNVVDSYFNEMLDKQMSLLEIIIELLKIIVDKDPTIVLDDNTLVGKLIDKINIALNQKQIESERGL